MARQWILIGMLFLFGYSAVMAQEEEEHLTVAAEETAHEEKLKRHTISWLLGYTLLPSLDLDGSRIPRIIPSFGLGYSYRINHWFLLNFSGEVEVESYVLVESEETAIERDYPVLLTLNTFFEPIPQLGIKLGAGIELDRNKNLFIYQIGAEYFIELPNEWVMGPEAVFIVKDNAANGLTFGWAFGKQF